MTKETKVTTFVTHATRTQIQLEQPPDAFKMHRGAPATIKLQNIVRRE